jgi:hypothetical protein
MIQVRRRSHISSIIGVEGGQEKSESKQLSFWWLNDRQAQAAMNSMRFNSKAERKNRTEVGQ